MVLQGTIIPSKCVEILELSLFPGDFVIFQIIDYFLFYRTIPKVLLSTYGEDEKSNFNFVVRPPFLPRKHN